MEVDTYIVDAFVDDSGKVGLDLNPTENCIFEASATE